MDVIEDDELGAEALQQSRQVHESLIGIATSQLARSDEVGAAHPEFVRRCRRGDSGVDDGQEGQVVLPAASPSYFRVQSLAGGHHIGGFAGPGFPGYSYTRPGYELLGS